MEKEKIEKGNELLRRKKKLEEKIEYVKTKITEDRITTLKLTWGESGGTIVKISGKDDSYLPYENIELIDTLANYYLAALQKELAKTNLGLISL